MRSFPDTNITFVFFCESARNIFAEDLQNVSIKVMSNWSTSEFIVLLTQH